MRAPSTPPVQDDAGATAARQGPTLVPEPVAGVAAGSIEAIGRRILSTAFVRVGPDGILTVERRDGTSLMLRGVTMGPDEYCGVEVGGGRYCGGYADVVAARPGGGGSGDLVDPVEPERPAPSRDPAR